MEDHIPVYVWKTKFLFHRSHMSSLAGYGYYTPAFCSSCPLFSGEMSSFLHSYFT